MSVENAMKKISSIAILVSKDSCLTFELKEVEKVFINAGIKVKFFHESDSIMAYKPDCVLITSPQDAKLTPFPTYGLINKPRDEYLETPRFLRNILTYDGFLTFSPRLKQMLEDVMFGARKLGTSILRADLFPATTAFANHLDNVDQAQLVIFEPDFTSSRMKAAIYHLLDRFENAIVVTCCKPLNPFKYTKRFHLVKDPDDITKILQSNCIAVCLNSGDQQEKIIYPAIIKLIAAGAVTITHETDLLKSYFGDNLYYISANIDVKSLSVVIKSHVDDIKANPAVAIKKGQQAHQVFLDVFALETLVEKFVKFHETTLVDKGYIPHPDPNVEKALPSVSYIMRTGGKHRPFLERTLDCLVAQQYPDLRVIFVIHAPVPFMHEIIEKYSTIKFKVIESIKSRRSEAIRDGIAAVETDLFGLFDDDDELFPNHLRSIVKALQYHSGRDWRGEMGMVYSASLHVDDTYPVFERVEYHDHKLTNKNEKRAIEHFKFYSSTLMSQHAWFMPNGWLARKTLIDEELLVDPQLDTCEDLYFELQLAQKTHFVFSAEVTAVHNFHHLGNSTIDDSHKHLPDTQRIALRNFSRVFPPDSLYDTQYSIVGKISCYDTNQIAYQEPLFAANKIEYYNQHAFYPFRAKQLTQGSQPTESNSSSVSVLFFPFKLFRYFFKFVALDKYRKGYYFKKFKTHIRQFGWMSAFMKIIHFMTNKSSHFSYKLPVKIRSHLSLREKIYKMKIIMHYLDWKKNLKGFIKNTLIKSEDNLKEDKQ